MDGVADSDSIALPQEIIENNIFLLRGHKVMFDKDLAILYGIKTRDLNKAVSRNINPAVACPTITIAGANSPW